jgi:hypothetical protein
MVRMAFSPTLKQDGFVVRDFILGRCNESDYL